MALTNDIPWPVQVCVATWDGAGSRREERGRGGGRDGSLCSVPTRPGNSSSCQPWCRYVSLEEMPAASHRPSVPCFLLYKQGCIPDLNFSLQGQTISSQFRDRDDIALLPSAPQSKFYWPLFTLSPSQVFLRSDSLASAHITHRKHSCQGPIASPMAILGSYHPSSASQACS